MRLKKVIVILISMNSFIINLTQTWKSNSPLNKNPQNGRGLMRLSSPDTRVRGKAKQDILRNHLCFGAQKRV